MHEQRAHTDDLPSVVIVGAGPAGLHAAFQLAAHGVKSTVIDENPRLGGVVYRGPLRDTPQGPLHDETMQAALDELEDGLEKYKDMIHILPQTRVMGSMESNDELALCSTGNGSGQNKLFPYRYKQLIICTGCHEKSIPFPGWTLPGVMTLGGAQLQVKSGLVRPAQKMILAGTGPLLLIAARQLHDAGIKVLGVYEAGRRLDLIRNSFAMIGNPLLQQGLQHLHYLKKAGIPVKYGWGIVEAKGEDEISEAVVAPYDKDWRPIIDKAETIQTDGLAVGFGFTPRAQLSQLLGTEQEYAEHIGMRPVTDDWMRTSIKHIQVAGDTVGVDGRQVAAEQGKIAALGCLMNMGKLSAQEAERIATPIRKTIARYQNFQAAIRDFMRPREGLLELAREDTVICRCENITRQSLDLAIEKGIQDITALKMSTRSGMGACQGKVCGDYCYAYLRKHLQKEDVGRLRPRFPLSPLSFDTMLTAGQEGA